MNPEKKFISEVLSDRISDWCSSKDISYLTSGGSGNIISVRNLDEEYCLKINRKKFVDDPITLLKEIKKILEEIRLILICWSDQIIPLYRADFHELQENERKIIIEKLELILSKSTLSEIYSEIESHLANILFHFKIDQKEEYYIGYLMKRGIPLDKVLDYFVQKLSDKTFQSDKFSWLNEILDIPAYITQHPDGDIIKVSKSQNQTALSQFVHKIIDDIIYALNKLHNTGYVHLDIKEANILCLPPKEPKGFPRFVLFDFGSAKSIDLIVNRTIDEFEATYQYLPNVIKRQKPISDFTSQNKVPIKFDLLGAEHVCSLDVHAFSCILNNILLEERYRKISAHIEYRDFENVFSIAQFISLDFKDDDKDSWALFEKGALMTQQLISILNKAKDIKIRASQDWKEWIEKVGPGYPEYITEDYVPPLDLQVERNPWEQFTHPASRLFAMEATVIKKLSPEERKDENTIKSKLEPIRKEYFESVCSLINATRILPKGVKIETIINTNLLNRSKELKQLGLTHLNPPEGRELRYAQHRRFEHSLGTMEIARLYLISLLNNCGWLRLRFIEDDGLFLLLLALYHDVGHFPFAHYLEDTKLFPKHKDIMESILIGDLYSLNLYDGTENSLSKHKMKDGPSKDAKWTTNNSLNPHTIPDRAVGVETKAQLRCCEVDDLIDFYQKLNIFLANLKIEHPSDDIKCFWNWTKGLFKPEWNRKGIDKLSEPERLVLRTYHEILSGPIDADKLHYIVNDSLHSYHSVATIFEGSEFNRLIGSLRIPIRFKEDSGTQRFCLGLDQTAIDLAQLVIFIRSAMFNEVYWSELSRSITTMLHFLICELFRIFIDTGFGEFKKYIGKIIRTGDNEARGILHELIVAAEKSLREEGLLAKYNNCYVIRDIHKRIYKSKFNADNDILSSDEPSLKNCYKELCRIYPSDKVAYNKICNSLTELKGNDSSSENLRLFTLDLGIYDLIRKITSDTLHLDLKNKLVHGSVLIDLPTQVVSKTKEFISFSVVDDKGYGRNVGKVWDAIENDFAENTQIIRVFLNPDIIKFDREDSEMVRSALITKLS